MKKPIQILTIAFALSMLATYIVYSQLQQTRSLASSSKSLGPAALATNNSAAPTGTNTVHATPTMVAPGSKTLAPVVKVHPTQSSSTSSAPAMIAPGSKFGAIYNPGNQPKAPALSTNLPQKATPPTLPTRTSP